MKAKLWIMVVCVFVAGANCCVLGDTESNTEVNRVIKKPKEMGDSGVALIMKEFGKLRSEDRRDAITALSESGSEKACNALLDIAMGKHGQENVEWAAGKYVEALKEKSKSRELLKSQDSAIQHEGLMGLKGGGIDQELSQFLKDMLQSSSLDVRRAAARVIQEAPDHPYTKEMTIALVESAKTVDSALGANQVISTSGLGRCTAAGYAYRCIVEALVCMKKADAGRLKSLTPEESGNSRDCVLIARAWLNDISVKHELKRIFQKSELSPLRSYALAAYDVVGTTDDVDFLNKIAESDPSAVNSGFMTSDGKIGKIYPNRIKAREIIKQIERKESSKYLPSAVSE